MPFRIPRFNLLADVYDFFGPPFSPRPQPRLTTPANLKLIKTAWGLSLLTASPEGTLLLVPIGTDIRPSDGFTLGPGDVIEFPQRSGRFYSAVGVEDVGKGFPNEYRCVAMVQAGYTGQFPIP